MTPAARERARVRTPLLIASACGWAALLLLPGSLLHAQHAQHAGHAGHHMAASPALPAVGPLALGWAVMLVAMMLPGMAAPVRHVQHRSLAVRRARATALFLGGYAAVWMAAGAVLLAAALVVPPQGLGAALVLLGVGLWQLSPFKQVCLNRLHGHPPLAAFGAAADRDVLGFGLKHGVWCVGSCSGLMLLPLLFPAAHLPLMLLVSVWIWAEQLERAEPPSFRVRVPLKAARILLAQLKLRGACRALASGDA